MRGALLGEHSVYIIANFFVFSASFDIHPNSPPILIKCPIPKFQYLRHNVEKRMKETIKEQQPHQMVRNLQMSIQVQQYLSLESLFMLQRHTIIEE
jgi:hypothetical protein